VIFLWNGWLCVFTANGKLLVEVTISLMILSGGSHEGSLLSYGFLLEGFYSIQTCWSSPHSSCKHTQSYLVVVFDLNHLGSLLSFSPGRGSCMIVVSAQIGLGGYYAKMIALGLVVISWLCFYIIIMQVDWENHEGYALHVLSVIIRSLCSLFIVSPIS
jgi:hypothetical protein